MHPQPLIKDTAATFLQSCARGEVDEAYDRCVAPGFRHHNPHFKGDADALKTAMRDNARQFPGKAFEILHVLQDGLMVAVHSRVRLQPGAPAVALVHLLRFEAGKIAELWDIGQAEPEQMANENGMF